MGYSKNFFVVFIEHLFLCILICETFFWHEQLIFFVAAGTNSANGRSTGEMVAFLGTITHQSLLYFQIIIF